MTEEAPLFVGKLGAYRTASLPQAPHEAAQLLAAAAARGHELLGAYQLDVWADRVLAVHRADDTTLLLIGATSEGGLADRLTWFDDGTLLYTTSLESPLDMSRYGVVHQRVSALDLDAVEAAHHERAERLDALCGGRCPAPADLEAALGRLDTLYFGVLTAAKEEAKRSKRST